MPRRAKGPRLWLQPKREARPGRPAEPAVWVIRDGKRKISTSILAGKAGPPQEAKDALRDYLNAQVTPRFKNRDPGSVLIADVLAIYDEDVVEKHADPVGTAARLVHLAKFFEGEMLACLNKSKCEAYAKWRATQVAEHGPASTTGYQTSARRELEDLRAAVRHHWEAGLCIALTPVVLPERTEARERWLTRREAARALRAAWRYREEQNFRGTSRHTRRHVARFILTGLYMGNRAGTTTGAALAPIEGHGWVDTENGVFYRRAIGRRKTKKRQPSVRVPPRYLAHVRRWKRLRVSYKFLIEWNGDPVKRINKAFRAVMKSAGLGKDVVPHTLRHTAITWQAQLGVPPHEICGFFGITMQIFEEVYAHHHPDYQSNAVNALNRRERAKRETSNVVPLAKAQ